MSWVDRGPADRVRDPPKKWPRRLILEMVMRRMETRDADVDVMLDRAKRFEKHGDREQALEQYRTALARIDQDDQRRGEIETALAYLEVSTVVAIKTAQMRAWRKPLGWSRRWRAVRWGALALVVLVELGILLLGKSIDFEGKLSAAVGLPTDTPVPKEIMTKAQEPMQMLAPTPLAPPLRIADAPTREPSPTSSSTMPPPTLPASSNASAGGRVSESPSQGAAPTAASTALPAATPASQPGSAPQPGPTVTPGPGPEHGPAPQPGGSSGPGPGGNSGGDGKGSGNGGGNGKGNGNGNGNGGGQKGKPK